MVIPITFFTRRMIFVITVLLMDNFLWGQLAIQNFVSLFLVIFIQWYKPFDTKLANTVETFNECTVIVLNYGLMCFTDFVPYADIRSTLGIYYLSLCLGNIFVHLIMMLGASLISIKNHIRKKGCLCCCKRTKNLNKRTTRTIFQKPKQVGSNFANT